MFCKATAILVTLLALSSVVKAQTVNLNCGFHLLFNDVYMCAINNVAVPDNENLEIVFGGQHLGDRSNADVTRVEILNSSIPFIMVQLFTSFPRLEGLTYFTNLTRFQPNAFANAANLQEFIMANSPDLQTIPANAFAGASALNWIMIRDSGIQTIDENAFNGLPLIRGLLLNRLQIRELPINVFQHSPLLWEVQLNGNFLEVLPGRLFEANPLVEWMFISYNRINAIERNFLDFLPALERFDLRNNICADDYWHTIRPGVTLDTIRDGLSVCFDNFDGATPEPELKTFVIELRGHLTVRDENGTEIITL